MPVKLLKNTSVRRLIGLLVFVIVISPPTIHVGSLAQEATTSDQEATTSDDAPDADLADSVESFAIDQLQNQAEGSFRVEDIAASSSWVSSTGIVDWLGPLAPLALSPFFGVTCLSGLSLWGPEWASSNAMLGNTGPLKNETLFVVFLVLTVLTSLPRLTKVSKPIAQALDQVETYSVIIILLLIKFVGPALAESGQPVAMIQMGVISFTLDTLLAIAMVINILVINSVKFFFEFLVWLTPVPFLDALFELCNKSLCAGLMAIYAVSPTVATVINLLMLVFAALVLRWVSRHVRFYRTMMLDPILSLLWNGYRRPKRRELIVFPKQPWGPFKAKSRLRMVPSEGDDAGWAMEEVNLLLPAKKHSLASQPQPQVRLGWVMHSIEVPDGDGDPIVFSFSRRYDEATLKELAEQLGMQMSEQPIETNPEELKYEFG